MLNNFLYYQCPIYVRKWGMFNSKLIWYKFSFATNHFIFSDIIFWHTERTKKIKNRFDFQSGARAKTSKTIFYWHRQICEEREQQRRMRRDLQRDRQQASEGESIEKICHLCVRSFFFWLISTTVLCFYDIISLVASFAS